MKKTILLALLAAPLFVACNDDKGQPNTETLTGELPAIITPADPALSPEITYLPIKVVCDYANDAKWTVAVRNFTLPSSFPLSFTTPEMTGQGIKNVSLNYLSDFPATTGQTISQFSTDVIADYNTLNGTPDNKGGVKVNTYFKVGEEYTIATFPLEAFYNGVTTAETGNGTFQNPNAQYKFMIDLKQNTVTLVIYNAKFAEKMPPLASVTLRGLKLKTSRQYGYEIEGKDITPTVGMGDNEVAYPNYIFHTFTMHPTDKMLTKVAIDYTVGDNYQGSFTGSYYNK